MSATNQPGSEYQPLSAYYTPLPLARAMVDRMQLRPGDVVVDPSSGGGSFIEALIIRDRRERLGLTILAIDVNAHAPSMLSTSGAFRRSVQSFLVKPVLWEVPKNKREEHDRWWRDEGGRQALALAGLYTEEPPTHYEVQSADPWPRDWPQPDVVLGNPPFGIKLPVPDEIRKAPIAVAEYHVRRAVTLAKRETLFLLPQSFAGSTKRATGLFVDHPFTGDLMVSPRPTFTAGGNDASEYSCFWWRKNAGSLVDDFKRRLISDGARPDLVDHDAAPDPWMSMFTAITGRLIWEKD